MSTVYELGPFRLDAEAGVLSHSGAPGALGARGVAVLRVLVEHAGDYVAKGTIIDAAWPGVVVEESNLAVQISTIRRVLAGTPGGEGWIETLARRGYRFVGPVTAIRDDKERHGRIERSNLPEPLTSFIGRERELVEIKRLLPGKRLLTLVGMGGIGKTRLALQVAAEVTDAYRDGVWLAELAAIQDPSLVPTTVAQALGVQERVGKPPIESLRSHLKSRQVLLLLDNCEHLLEACARLVDAVLGEAEEATIMATSREPLRVAGEQIYPLLPLSLPERGASAEMMKRSEAVQLLVERVQCQLPDFELTAGSASAAAELCIHLDGIPLALELAAARARSLSVEQINARLSDRFRLLTGGSRTALARQQTLRATLDWSYDLLAEAERVVLRRLSIFPGSFGAEAASAVASDTNIDEFAVIDLLSQLVARSLVIADTSEGKARYRLLETTRAYAVEKLAEVGEIEGRKRRHAEYYRTLFEPAPDDWWRLSDRDWRIGYFPELDNVRAALDWAFGSGGDLAIGLSLSAGSTPLWTEAGLSREGSQRLHAAVAAIGPDTPHTDQARLWFWLGFMGGQALSTQTLGAYERALDLYRRGGDVLGAGLSLMRIGTELIHFGRTDEAAPILGEVLPLLERAGHPKALAQYLLALGTLKWFEGDLRGARAEFERLILICRQEGAQRVESAALSNLAEVAWTAGDLDTALARCREAVALARQTGRKAQLVGRFLTNLAGVHVERGELDLALAAAREGLPLRSEVGSAWCCMDHLALRAALTGKQINAARIAGYADAAHLATAAKRQPNEARAHAQVHALLREKLTVAELARLLAEGAAISEDEAIRLALEE